MYSNEENLIPSVKYMKRSTLFKSISFDTSSLDLHSVVYMESSTEERLLFVEFMFRIKGMN